MKKLHRSDLYCCSVFDEERNIDFNGSLWVSPLGNVLIDPVRMEDYDKKHLESLMIAHKQGYESHLIFLIQIEKCKSFGIASDIDPEYYDLLKIALKKNVKVL